MASAGLPVYDTEFLMGAYGVIDAPNPFLLNLAFPNTQQFDTASIAFDKVDRARRLAPFASPYARGTPMRQQGFVTKDFRPPYVKPKHIVDIDRPLKRMAGERLLGSDMSPEMRYQRVVMDLMRQEDEEITRREEWMAAQILVSGGVVVEGDDYSPQLVSFGRPSSHTIQLTGVNAWGQSGVSPMANLRSWNAMVIADSGFNPSIVIMDPVAEQLFIADATVYSLLNNRVNTPIGPNFGVGNIKIAGALAGAIGEEVKLLGQIGEFIIYVYNQTYVDSAGNVQTMIPPGTVMMLSPMGFQGTRCYAAIRDPKAGYRAMSRFPKMWVEEDPPITSIMTQAAPLLVTGWPEASLSANVLY